MAGEEDDDVELRDLVAQTLESQGVLGSIRVRLLIKNHLSIVQYFDNLLYLCED